MKKYFMILVAALMVACVSSCSSSDDENNEEKSVSLVGKEFVSENYVGAYLDYECNEHFEFTTNSTGVSWYTDSKTGGTIYISEKRSFEYSSVYPNMKINKFYSGYKDYKFTSKTSFYRTEDDHVFHLE